MRKNALGLATITILSSMFLVTMVGGLNIYIGGKDYIANQNPNDYSIDVGMQPTTSKEQTEEWAEAILEETDIPVESKVVYPYQQAYFSEVTNQQIKFLTDEEAAGMAFSDRVGIGLVLDQASYEKMTGENSSWHLTKWQFIVRESSIKLVKPSPLMKRRWKLPKSCPRM